jgi:cytoskeletal protein RodZ
MIRRIRRLPSPALVISAIALIIAVGGGTFAIASSDNKRDKKIAKKVANKQIKKKAPGLSVNHANSADSASTSNSVNTNGVNTSAIQDNAVTTPKIADNAVTTPKIADNAVSTSKIADATVTSQKIADNAVANPKIADNAVTAPKIADESVRASELGSTQQVVSASVPIAANPGTATAIATCPAGTQLLSGGGGTDSIDVVGVESFQAGNGWLWFARNFGGAPHNIFATAVCLNA